MNAAATPRTTRLVDLAESRFDGFDEIGIIRQYDRGRIQLRVSTADPLRYALDFDSLKDFALSVMYDFERGAFDDRTTEGYAVTHGPHEGFVVTVASLVAFAD